MAARSAKLVKLKDIKPNPDNPRVIRDDAFDRLTESIRSFPEMLEIRPIVVNTDMVVLGGNMRLRAAAAAGLKQVPVIIAADLTAAQQREFIIKDNVAGGEWDWDALANDWPEADLHNWGLDVPNWDTEHSVDDMFEQHTPDEHLPKHSIVLRYDSEEQYKKLLQRFSELSGTPAEIVYDLLVTAQ